MTYGTFDIESEDWIKFRCLGMFDGTRFRWFRSVDAFLDELDQRKWRGWRWYAHNGGKFDFLFMMEAMLARNWKFELMERAGRIVSMKVHTRSNYFQLADSYALLPFSLQRLSDTFKPNHPKLKFEFEPGRRVTVTKDLLTYLENDCRCLFEVLSTFFQSEYVTTPQLTIASQALNTFRTQFVDCEIYRSSLEHERQFRDVYYSGGRVEVFQGLSTVWTYDVNSLFPTMMLNDLPAGRARSTTTYQRGKFGFYHVEVKQKTDFHIPPFLVKTKKPRRNFYVNAPGRFFVSSALMEHLKAEYGIGFRVLDGIYFEDRYPLCRSFVETFYDLKKNAKNDVEYLIAKLMLNSLYGKFAQSRWHESLEVYNGQKNFSLFDEHYGLVLVERSSRSRFMLPYLAAWITDTARLYHWKLMQKKPEDVMYCDTDSIYAASPFLKEYVGPEIGQLSFEGKYDGVFIAPKCYALRSSKKQKVVFKGFDTQRFSFAKMRQALLAGSPLEETKERILSFRESLKRKAGVIRSSGPFLKMVEMTKTATGLYEGRHIERSRRYGFRSFPYQFSDVSGKKITDEN
jgi:hypothetical protein